MLVAAGQALRALVKAGALYVQLRSVFLRRHILAVFVNDDAPGYLLERGHGDIALDVADQVQAVALSVLRNQRDAVADRCPGGGDVYHLAVPLDRSGDLVAVRLAKQRHHKLRAAGAHQAVHADDLAL